MFNPGPGATIYNHTRPPYPTARLHELHARGLQVHVDDFGTGYSSLQALHRLPIDVLKIDKSFVAGLGHDDRTAELVRTIVQLGNNLGVVVIAEGVETPGQHDCLRQLGCGFGQGFLFSAPVPAAELEALVASGHFARGLWPGHKARSRPEATTLRGAQAIGGARSRAVKSGTMPLGAQVRWAASVQRVPLFAVSAVVAWNLWSFRAATLPVAYLYDAPVHGAMVRFATAAIEAGRLPFTSWFPNVGLGSAQYLHYQSLGSVLTGLAGTVVGAGLAFRLALYLLVALWPFAIYSSARVFGLPRAAATVAALISPFVVSYTGIAFERGAYSWIGGAEVWTQLFGMWALPFAWATTWRASKDARYLWPAALLVGLTFAFHFLCGYLAFFGVIVMALVAEGQLLRRLARAAVVLGGALASAAWVVVPLMLLSKWSAINEILAETPYVKGYGARQELQWLFKGQIFDARRGLPVISVLVLLGLVLAVAHWKADPIGRALVALFVACLLLSFGATTWGPLIDLVPAHADLYFRRFNMGSQLAGIYLAGMGVALAWKMWWRLAARLRTGKGVRVAALGCFTAAAVAWFSPAAIDLAHYDHNDATTIETQRASDTTEGALIAPLIEYIRKHGGGRVYAGLSSNWGQKFLVGYVPVYKYLVSQDVDEMTYVVPTTSLMLGPEAEFDEDNPADYALFGVRYLLLPAGLSPAVPAQEIMAKGAYSLWQYSDAGYAELVQVTGRLTANRLDIGPQSQLLLDTLGAGQDWSVAWPGLAGPRSPKGPSISPSTALPSPGIVASVRPDLGRGEVSAEVTMTEPGALLFSVAYDPGWHAWVDGQPVRTEMLAPALVGVQLTPGRHHVVLRYIGFRWYPELWAAGLLSLVVLGAGGRWWYKRDAARTSPT